MHTAIKKQKQHYQIHPQKIMPYKNGTSCEKNTQRLLARG